MSTELKIPGDILEAAGLTERDCLIELAVHLYAQRRIPIGLALRLARLSRTEFEQELARRNPTIGGLTFAAAITPAGGYVEVRP